jgi:oligosaccharide repeat unit polymerase
MTAFDTFNFAASLIACALAMLVLQKRVCAGLPKNLLTLPALVFSWVYFVVVPFANVVFDTYVDEFVFTEEPILSITRLNYFNAALLLVAVFGTMLARKREYKPPPKEQPFDAAILALLLLLVVQLAWGFYLIYFSGNFLSEFASQDAWQGSLAAYAVVESAPLAFCWLVTLYYARKGERPIGLMVPVILLVELVLLLGLSSSRGSRVAMLSQLFFCVMIFNYSIYRFKLRDYLLGALACGLFLPIYAYYKYAGIEGLRDYLSGNNTASVAETYNNPVSFLIGDIGRADMQAPLLARYLEGSFSPNYYGESYLAAFTLLIPKDARPSWLRSKTQVGAQAQLDRGTGSQGYRGVISVDGVYESSRIYGLFGEALLNFGLFGLPFAFLLFGYLFRRVFLKVSDTVTWRQLLVAPYLCFVPIFMLFYDLDNILVQTLSVWAVPFLTVFVADKLAARKHRHSRPATE